MTVNDWLVISILLVALLKCEWLVAGIMLATTTHSVIDHAVDMSGYSYYISSALVDAVAVFFIARNSPVSSSVKFIQSCCLAFIAAHIFGFVWWYIYNPPFIYNVVCSIIYASMLVNTIIKGGRLRVGCNRGGSGIVVSRPSIRGGSEVVREHEDFRR